MNDLDQAIKELTKVEDLLSDVIRSIHDFSRALEAMQQTLQESKAEPAPGNVLGFTEYEERDL